MSEKEQTRSSPQVKIDGSSAVLPSAAQKESKKELTYRSRLEKVILGSYDKIEELVSDLAATLFSKNPEEVILKNIEYYEQKNGESVFGKKAEFSNKSNFEIVLSIIPLDAISNMTFGTGLELVNIVRDEIQYQSYALNKEIKREDFLQLKQTQGFFLEVDAALGVIEAIGCAHLVVASGGTNVSALNKTWKFCRVFGVNLTTSVLNSYADELLKQSGEKNTNKNSELNLSRMINNTALSMGNSAVAGGIIRLAGMGYYSQMKSALLPKVTDLGTLSRGGLALDRAMERYNKVASLVDIIDDYGDLKEGLLCFAQIKNWDDAESVKTQLLAASIKTLTAAHGAIEFKTSGITDFTEKSSDPDVRVEYNCYGEDVKGRIKADGSICYLESKDQLRKIFYEWTKESRKDQGWNDQQIETELNKLSAPNSFYDPKTARIYALEISTEMSEVERIEAASWEVHEYVHRNKGTGKKAEFLAYQAQLAFLEEHLLPYGYTTKFNNSQLIIEKISPTSPNISKSDIEDFIDGNYSENEVLARSTDGDSNLTRFVSGNCLAGLNIPSIEIILQENPRALGWELFTDSPSIDQGEPTIVNVGPGIYPFDTLDIAEHLRFGNRNAKIYAVEQNSAISHVEVEFFDEDLIYDGDIKRRLIELGHNPLDIRELKIENLILRVDPILRPTSLIARMKGRHDTEFHDDIRYYTVDTAPHVSFRRLGRDINRTEQESLISKLSEKYRATWLPILRKGQNIYTYGLKVKFDPLQSTLERNNIELCTVDDLSQLNLSDVTCFTVFNILVHLSLEERAKMLKELGSRLKDGGLIGIRHEEITFLWQRVGDYLLSVPRKSLVHNTRNTQVLPDDRIKIQ